MKKPVRRWIKTYSWVFGILLIGNWFLLWSRFYWFGFRGVTQTVFEILNFPLSQTYLWIEAKTNPWWNGAFGTTFNFILNDEFGPLVVLLLIDIVQAAIFTLLISGFLKLWRAVRRSSKPAVSA